MATISENFLNELFQLILRKKDILETCSNHLKYQFLPTEIYKKIWKYIQNYYTTNKKLTTIGLISQAFLHDKDSKEINEVLSSIVNADILDEEQCFVQLEEYVKDAMSQTFYDEFHEKYTTEENKEVARVYMREMADKIGNFRIRDKRYYSTVFSDFNKRNRERILQANSLDSFNENAFFAIDELDDITNGIEKTDTVCLLARSGVGKTKFLRWVGLGNARRGLNVCHIQAEGSKSQCLVGYDATWTAVLVNDIKTGSIPEDKYNDLEKVIKGIEQKGVDIFVHAFEQFNSGTMSDVRAIIADLFKEREVDLIVIDYLERLEPGDGLRYSKGSMEGEKMRRSAIADKMKNLALEFGTRIITATQANDIPPHQWNNPEWVMDRHNVSMAKNLPDSFSYFLTLNQTMDERKVGLARIFCDKFRWSDSQQVVKIYQDFDHDRFYNRNKTLRELYRT